MLQTTITREQEEATWAALWDRGYDSYDLVELLAEEALKSMAYGADMATAIKGAEQACGVHPRGTWCPQCREGGTEADWSPERCEWCGGWLEVT